LELKIIYKVLFIRFDHSANCNILKPSAFLLPQPKTFKDWCTSNLLWRFLWKPAAD